MGLLFAGRRAPASAVSTACSALSSGALWRSLHQEEQSVRVRKAAGRSPGGRGVGEATAAVSIGISDTEEMPHLPHAYVGTSEVLVGRTSARGGAGRGRTRGAGAPAGSRLLVQVLRALSGARGGRRRGGRWCGRPGVRSAETCLPAVSVPHKSVCQGRLLSALVAVLWECVLASTLRNTRNSWRRGCFLSCAACVPAFRRAPEMSRPARPAPAIAPAPGHPVPARSHPQGAPGPLHAEGSNSYAPRRACGHSSL